MSIETTEPLCDDRTWAPQQKVVADQHPIEAIVVVHLPSGSHQPTALTSILGRSSLQRHLIHLSKLGIKRCALLLVGSAKGNFAAEVRNLVKDPQLDGLCVSIWPVEGTNSHSLVGELAEHVLWVEGEGVLDPRLYQAVWAAPAPVQLVDHTDQPKISRRKNGGYTVTEGATAVGLAKLDADAALAAIRQAAERANDGFRFGQNGGAANIRAMSLEELPTYLPSMRRHLRPYWCSLRQPRDFRRAERMILDSAQKGVLDFPARVLHPLPENFLTRLLARTPVTPNHITVLTGIIAFVATYLFAVQSYAWGLAIALLVNVLDGVDGKLARVKLLSSRFGDRLDHFLDVTFEFSWYLALGWGLSQTAGNWLPLQLGIGLIAVMLTARGLSGVYKLLSGHQVHDHRRFDRAFRWIAGRRNIYIWLLLFGAIVGRMEEAFFVLFGWGVATVAVYMVRSLMAFAERNNVCQH